MSRNLNMVKDFFSGYAGKWDSLYGKNNKKDPISRFTDNVLRRVIKVRFVKTLEIVKSHGCKSVLDVGCGSGRYVLEFAREGLQVHGIDFANEMLEIANESLKREALENRASLNQISWQEFEVKQKFDAIVAIGFFDYQEDPASALLKMVQASNKLVIASFPKSSGFLAFQRRIRYQLRKCPLWMYSKRDIEKLILKLDNQKSASILNLGRDYLLVVNQ
jgi:2-polyprenyl-3-methyl-5-hydroxy-6-metoxy-1,4-benzoquinol methylase